MDERPRLAIVGGGGGMGRLMARLLLMHSETVSLVDPVFAPGKNEVPDSFLNAIVGQWLAARPTWRSTATKAGEIALHGETRSVAVRGVAPAKRAEALHDSSVVLFAVPFFDIAHFRATIAPYVASFAPGTLVADTASIKVAPLAVLDSLVPRECDVVGMHPLFGPGVVDVTGNVVAMVPSRIARVSSKWRGWLAEALVAERLLVTPCDAETHDHAMSHVQVLTHFVLLALARCIVVQNIEPADLLPFRTPVFETLLYLAGRVAVLAWESPETYATIQRQAVDPRVLRDFMAAAHELLDHVERAAGGEPGAETALETLLVRTGAYWGHIPTSLKADPRERVSLDVLTELERGKREPFRRGNILGMSNSATAAVSHVRRDLLESAGSIRAVRDLSSGATFIGQIYVDPEHHDKVDLSSRVRFRRVNLPIGLIEEPGKTWAPELSDTQRQERIEASLSAIPIAHAQFLTTDDLFAWLDQALDGRDLQSQSLERVAPGSELNRFAIRFTRAVAFRAPAWFDESVLNKLLRGLSDKDNTCLIWRVRFAWLETAAGDALRAGQLFAHCFLRPEAAVFQRSAIVRELLQVDEHQDSELTLLHLRWALSSVPLSRDQQTAVDRAVRRRQRACIESLVTATKDFLFAHGCSEYIASTSAEFFPGEGRDMVKS